MKTEQIEEMLISSTADVKAAKSDLFEAAENTIIARAALDSAKATVFALGKIDGKNDQVREAQYALNCPREIEGVKFTEAAERRARHALDQYSVTLDLAGKLLRIAEICAGEAKS